MLILYKCIVKGHTRDVFLRSGCVLFSITDVLKRQCNNMFNETDMNNASGNYSEKFEQDLIEADREIIISNPDIRADKIDRFIKIVKTRQEKGVSVTVITTNPETAMFGSSSVYYELIHEMETVGITIVLKDEIDEHFAVIDDQIVWHVGMNLLGKEDVWDNLMRIKNLEVAAELLEIELGRGLETIE